MRRPPRRRRDEALDDVVGLEQWSDAEARVVVADAADRDDARTAFDRDPDVVDHLPGVLLEDGDGPHPARRPRRRTSSGNGQRAIGRTQPTRIPCARHARTAYLAKRAGEPNATTATSASSSSPVSQRRLGRGHAPVLLDHDLEVLAVAQVELLRRAQRCDVVGATPARTGGGPGLGRQVRLVARPERDRLRGVAEHEVAQHDRPACASGR